MKRSRHPLTCSAELVADEERVRSGGVGRRALARWRCRALNSRPPSGSPPAPHTSRRLIESHRETRRPRDRRACRDLGASRRQGGGQEADQGQPSAAGSSSSQGYLCPLASLHCCIVPSLASSSCTKVIRRLLLTLTHARLFTVATESSSRSRTLGWPLISSSRNIHPPRHLI